MKKVKKPEKADDWCEQVLMFLFITIIILLKTLFTSYWILRHTIFEQLRGIYNGNIVYKIMSRAIDIPGNWVLIK